MAEPRDYTPEDSMWVGGASNILDISYNFLHFFVMEGHHSEREKAVKLGTTAMQVNDSGRMRCLRTAHAVQSQIARPRVHHD